MSCFQLAAFQKKKSKKKHSHHHHHHGDETVAGGDSSVSSIDQSSSSDVPLFEDSDQNMTSEDETMCTQIAEMEVAMSKRDEIIRQLTTRLQSTASLQTDAEQLTHHVQQLQAQLINAGKLMESQNSKQLMSSQALLEAKHEIEALQKCIEAKDTLVSQLSDKVGAISDEYVNLKTSYEASRQKEAESSKVVKSLMSDAEDIRRQGSVNGSVTVSNEYSDVDDRVQKVRLELEETYGNQIALMKDELSKHYNVEVEKLTRELNNFKEICAKLESDGNSLEEEKLKLTERNTSNDLLISELQSKLTEINSKCVQIQSEKDELTKENLTLSKQIDLLSSQLESTNHHHPVSNGGEPVQEDDNSESYNKIKELNEKNLNLTSELDTIKKDYANAQKNVEELEKKVKGGNRPARFQVDSQEIVMELKQVTEQYEEALVNIAMMQGRIEDYDIKCEILNEDLNKIKEQLKTSEDAVKNYEEQTKEFDKIKDKLGKSEQEIKSFEDRVKEYESKHETVLSELSDMTEQCTNAQRQCEEYRDKFVEYEQQLTDYEGLTTQYNELQHECNVYQTQNDELNNKMNIQQDVVMELKAELEILSNQNQAFQEQSPIQTQQIEDLTKENKCLLESIDLHKDEVTKLTNSLNQATAEVDTYKEKTQSLESLVETLEVELKSKCDTELILKQKDDSIKKLTNDIDDLTLQLHMQEPVEESFQKETITHEEASLSLSNQVVSQNETKDIENAQVVQSEAQSALSFDSFVQEELEHQSELALHVVSDMEADSLDGDTVSIEDSKQSDLIAEISKLQHENHELKLTIQNIKVTYENDLEQALQSCRSEIVNVSAEKSNIETSYLELEENIVNINEKVKLAESALATVEEEKLALQNDLTFVNSMLDEMTQNEGLSQSDSNMSITVCNKLKTLQEKLEIAQSNTENLSSQSEKLKTEKLENIEIHKNIILHKQEENDNLCKELECLQIQMKNMETEVEKSKQLLKENDSLNKSLQEMNEREQTLRIQCERLSQQVFELSVINQTVSGDKENLENRFVEVSAMENNEISDSVVNTHVNEVMSSKKSHDLLLTNQQLLPISEHDNDVKCKVTADGETLVRDDGPQKTTDVLVHEGEITQQSAANQSTTVRSTCMPTSHGQVMNVCSSVCVNSVIQLPQNSVHDLVASNFNTFDFQMIASQNDDKCCKQAENLDQSEYDDPENLTSVNKSSDQTLHQSCENTNNLSQNHDTDLNKHQDTNSSSKNDDNFQDADASSNEYTDHADVGENENENNEQSEHLRNENTILKVKLEDTQNDMSAILHDRVELVGSMENFSDKINYLRDHNERLQKELKRSFEDNKVLLLKVEESNESSEIRCKLEDKIIELVSENQKLKSEYGESRKALKDEHESLKSALNSWQEASSSSQQLKAEVTGLFNEMERLSEQKQDMESSLQAMEEAFVTSQSLNEELQRQALENCKNLNDMEKWKIHAQDLEGQLRESEEKLETKTRTWKIYVGEIENKQKEKINDLEYQVEQKAAEVNELRNINSELESKYQQLHEDKEQLQEECKACQTEISHLYLVNTDLVQERDTSLIQWEHFRPELNKLTEKCTMQESFILELKSKQLQLITDIKLKQEKCDSIEIIMAKEKVELQGKCSNYENQLIQMKECCFNLEKQVEEITEKCAMFEKQKEEMMVQQNDLIKDRESVQSENKLLKEKCDKFSQEVENMNISLKNKYQEYESSLGELEKKNMKLKETCEKSDIDAVNLNKNHSEVLKQKEKQIEKLEQKVITCSLQINELHVRCKQTDNALKDVEFKYSDLKQIKEKAENEELSDLSSQNHELSTKLESLENIIKDKDLDCENLTQKFKELEKSFVSVQTENKELLQNCKNIELKKKAMKTKYSQLVQTSNETEEKLQKTISNLTSMNNDLNEKCEAHEEHIQNLNIDIEKIDQVKANVQQTLKETSERNNEVESSLKEVQDENKNSEESSVTSDIKEKRDAHDVHVQENYEAVDAQLTERPVHVNDAEEIKESKKEEEEDDELISEEELEVLIQQRIDHEKKQIEYDLEEKYELQFRKRQVELMHTFEKKQKDLQKDFEQNVNHRVESLRAEKDQSFVKALQKVKKDFEKKLKKEMEKQRLAHLQELATMQDERKGGGHISGVVKNLLQENQELAEARDALLQQVELSHHQQDKLEDELRSMMEENIEGEGEFLQEPIKLNTEKPRHSYRSQSLLLDWEFSPSSSFDQDKDPPGLSGQFEYDCQNLQCLLLRRKYQELRNTVQLSGFQPELNIAEDFHSVGPGFKPEIVDYVHNEPETDLSTPTTELEASFVKEALRKAAESFSEVKQSTNSTPTVDAFIENVGSKDDIFKSRESVATTEEFLPLRVRSLSLNLPQDTDLMDCDEISEVDKKHPSFIGHVRHRSLDRFIGQNIETEGKFVAEFFHDQTPLSQLNKSQDRISQSSDGKLKVNIVSKRNSWNSSLSSQTSLSQSDLQLSIDHVTESKSEKSEHNSQGEFFVEYISGDLETLDQNTLNEIAVIQSNSPHLGEVTPHFDFALELTKDEKLDNDKLLKKLDSLKNIYCKEKQDLMSKCENLTIQLENESLSRRQLEQELINISEDFGETFTKPETEISIISQRENNTKQPPKKTLTDNNTLQKENVPKSCHFESMIKSLECELHEKEDSLKQQNIEIGMGEALQEQRLNEMKVLYKSELRKLEVENSSLLEQKYQLENQNRELNQQSESKELRGGNCKSCISVESQTDKLELNNEKKLLEKQQLIDQLETHNSKIESDLKVLFVKEKEKEITIKELTEKCQNLEMRAQEKVQLVEQLDQQCASYKMRLQTTGHESTEMKQVGSFIELQEKCKNLELELESAKQNETFACVYEEKCNQLESDLENKQENEQDLMEMTEKFERLEKEYKEQNMNHLQELNSCTSVIDKLRQKCENIDGLLANEKKVSQETYEKCEHYLKELTLKQTLLKEIEEKSSKDAIQLEELKYENEHVIQELTTQCQKYQSEIQALRAKELLKIKKTLSCSVDEIESTDYQEFIVDSSSCIFDDEEEKIPGENKENKSEFDNKIEEDILVQKTASYVETDIHDDKSGVYERVTELETLLKDKDALIRKYETELDQRNDELDRMDDLRQYQEHLEMSVREKDSYIKQLEEHFLQQRTPVSVRSPVKPGKFGNVGQPRKDEPAAITCSTPTLNLPENIHSSEMELQDNLSDQSTISGDNSFTKQKSHDSLLSDKTDNDGNFVTHSKFNDSFISDSKNDNTQTSSAISESGSRRSEEASISQMDMKHFAIVEEISKLRQDLRETKSVYTQENTLLREALDKEKWNRDSKLESQDVKQHFSSEVGKLQQKVSLLKETNDMLRNENDKWLKRVQEQETIVLQLREQLSCDVNKDENKCDLPFNQQLKLLQQQRNELVERLSDSENKIGNLSQSLIEKSTSEENLRTDKAKLQTKLYEMEEVEKELTEKKIELEKQKATQSRLEEVIYHRDLIERELMKQKRLLEVELAEIECKLHEKEELLEIQKNQLLEEIKQNYSSDRISDTSKRLSSSFESSDFSFEGARSKPLSRTPQPHTSPHSASKSKTTTPVTV
ncbi:unnamed protein product [Mytilus edulis]|uniref:Uncharacterized protein n=2 Tax=Mytilus edulis TaxID=6550 RepID=A0A8S3PYG9_MYTED|nr:unnamed protein product [Mytilus edulis]